MATIRALGCRSPQLCAEITPEVTHELSRTLKGAAMAGARTSRGLRSPPQTTNHLVRRRARGSKTESYVLSEREEGLVWRCGASRAQGAQRDKGMSACPWGARKGWYPWLISGTRSTKHAISAVGRCHELSIA